MKRVLIVDDDFLVRTYLKQMIDWEKQGFYIVGDAKNGRAALEILQRDGADILIADVSMPIMDGIELTRNVKKIAPRAHILILSCHDDFVYVKEAMKLGIDDYLLKNDLSEETLLDALNKISFDAEFLKSAKKIFGNYETDEKGILQPSEAVVYEEVGK